MIGGWFGQVGAPTKTRAFGLTSASNSNPSRSAPQPPGVCTATMLSSPACSPRTIGRSSSANFLSPALPRYDLLSWWSTSRCSASLITLRIGVLPPPSRKTPTPTSIFSGRESAAQRPMSAIRESLWTGGRSDRLRAFTSVLFNMNGGLARLGVVIHCDPVTDRNGLAGQHITGRDLLFGEAVMDRHFDLAAGHLGPARRANACLASEGRGQPRSTGAVENVPGGERNATRAAIESH